MHWARFGLFTSSVSRYPKGNGWKTLGARQFDLIHVGAAAERVPDELLRALKPGGVMVRELLCCSR
jgi:protein-L-isoaspartate O-methyltransferase